jgi:hypothetical protein
MTIKDASVNALSKFEHRQATLSYYCQVLIAAFLSPTINKQIEQ